MSPRKAKAAKAAPKAKSAPAKKKAKSPVSGPDALVSNLLLLVAYVRKNNGATVKQVAKHLRVPEAQVLAYVDELLLCGKPPFAPDDCVELWVEDEHIHIVLDQKLGQPLRLAYHEALALVIALRAVSGSQGGRHVEAARTALAKIRKQLGRDIDGRVEEVEHRIMVAAEDRGVEERFAALATGQRDHRAVDIRYWTASRDQITKRRIRPYLLMQNLGSWYVVGHDELRGEERMFKVERIEDARVSDETFTVPAHFDAERYRRRDLFLAKDPREARIKLYGAAARILAEDWDPSRVERNADGTVVARLRYVAEEGLAHWVMSFAGDAEVLEPPELRERVAALTRAALASYEA